jgi:hypothetical protein
MGGRGFIDITQFHGKQVKLLQTYFLNKQVTSPLHAAVVKADDRYTPLDLFCANENKLTTDKEYTNKVKRQWSQKALHGQHPYDHPTICRQRSVEQMADKRRFVRQNRGLFNSNTGPSHINKKLQEIYFEVAKH